MVPEYTSSGTTMLTAENVRDSASRQYADLCRTGTESVVYRLSGPCPSAGSLEPGVMISALQPVSSDKCASSGIAEVIGDALVGPGVRQPFGADGRAVGAERTSGQRQ
jgi:hypothetical protein